MNETSTNSENFFPRLVSNAYPIAENGAGIRTLQRVSVKIGAADGPMFMKYLKLKSVRDHYKPLSVVQNKPFDFLGK
jgi:hypothetical protein